MRVRPAAASPRALRMAVRWVLPTLVVGVLSACTLLPWYRVPDDAFGRGTVTVDCCVAGDAEVELTYLGVGGWIFRTPETAVLAAPMYSNPGVLETGLLPIAADPEVIDRELPPVADVSAVLVGHGHYDHLMDVPWILEHRTPEALLVTNRTSWHQVEPFGFGLRPLEAAGDELRPVAASSGRIVVIPDSAAASDREDGRWIRVSDHVRVLPLLSDHAAHLAGVTLFSGERRRAMPRPPASAAEWLEGRTYAFVVDLLAADGTRRMRIYYQDAVAAPPYGLVPPSVEGTVDVAVVVPATYAEVDWHPEALLDDARPRHVLLGHWEDFFRPPEEADAPVMFTLLADFRRRLERALPPGSGYHLPVPGTHFRFR